jgi:hypothetical protein
MAARIPHPPRRRQLTLGVGSWWLGFVTVLLLAAACNRPPPRPHESLPPDLQTLKAQFNKDADRTRVLMIVAPT